MLIGEKLFVIRKELRLSQIELANQLGVSEDDLRCFESALFQKGCKANAKKKISEFVKSHSELIPYPECPDLDAVREKEKNKLNELKNKIFHSFIQGRRYRIQEGKTNPYEFEFNPLNGKGCTFIYLRKEGRHHMFREERGGWIRTYTDNQLIGKYIKEVYS